MMIGYLPKMRNRIVSVAGDYYYEPMSLEDTLEKGLIELPEGLVKSQEDVDLFLQENLARKLPLDGPQWRYYFTNITKEDGSK